MGSRNRSKSICCFLFLSIRFYWEEAHSLATEIFLLGYICVFDSNPLIRILDLLYVAVTAVALFISLLSLSSCSHIRITLLFFRRHIYFNSTTSLNSDSSICGNRPIPCSPSQLPSSLCLPSLPTLCLIASSGGVSTWTDKGFLFDFHRPSFSIVRI